MKNTIQNIAQAYRGIGEAETATADAAYLLNFFSKIGFKESAVGSFTFKVDPENISNPVAITVSWHNFRTGGITMRVWVNIQKVGEKNLPAFGNKPLDQVANELKPHLETMFEIAMKEIDILASNYKDTIKKAMSNMK